MTRRLFIVAQLFALIAIAAGAQSTPSSLDAVLAKAAAYVASYGEKASLIVAVEKYSQNVAIEGEQALNRPRQIVAEFALVKASGGSAWVGFRDVVEVNGDALRDRRDRLVSLFTSKTGDASEVERISNESARFNVGPVVRNFNVPTSAMFFFTAENLPRFQFTSQGSKKIDGINTIEIAFKETRSPTFVMTRAGKDVPIDGTLWIVPEDGTIVRTRMHMTHFADQVASPAQQAPSAPVAPTTNNPRAEFTPAPARNFSLDIKELETAAEIDVTFKRNAELGIWLPSVMEETYNGPIKVSASKPAAMGRASTRARYSDFKQFATSGAIVVK